MSKPKPITKLSRELRLCLAFYVASRCGLSSNELDLEAIIVTPSLGMLKGFHGSIKQRRRVTAAIEALIENAIRTGATDG